MLRRKRAEWLQSLGVQPCAITGKAWLASGARAYARRGGAMVFIISHSLPPAWRPPWSEKCMQSAAPPCENQHFGLWRRTVLLVRVELRRLESSSLPFHSWPLCFRLVAAIVSLSEVPPAGLHSFPVTPASPSWLSNCNHPSRIQCGLVGAMRRFSGFFIAIQGGLQERIAGSKPPAESHSHTKLEFSLQNISVHSTTPAIRSCNPLVSLVVAASS